MKLVENVDDLMPELLTLQMLDDATEHVANVVKEMRESPYLKDQADSAATNYDKVNESLAKALADKLEKASFEINLGGKRMAFKSIVQIPVGIRGTRMTSRCWIRMA